MKKYVQKMGAGGLSKRVFMSFSTNQITRSFENSALCFSVFLSRIDPETKIGHVPYPKTPNIDFGIRL